MGRPAREQLFPLLYHPCRFQTSLVASLGYVEIRRNATHGIAETALH